MTQGVPPGAALDDAVWSMLNGALGLYRDSARASHWLRQHLERFAEPLRIAVAGQPQSGKSTLVNALVGEEVAPIPGLAAPAFTWYRDGPSPRAVLHPPQGSGQELPIARQDRRLVVTGSVPGGAVDRVVVDWPTRSLRDATLVDTPAIGAADGARGTVPQLAGEADAVVYLTRHVHGLDLRFLQSAQDHPIARATPVNTILVLSRADEVGATRVDALTSARQVARRHRGDAQVRGLCQTVVAVAGLVAQAGRTLRDDEFDALEDLARVSRPALEPLLLSADRFVSADVPADAPRGVAARLDRATRMRLLERFGLFGVRLATTLLRTGVGSPSALAAELVNRSGLVELRESIGSYFTERAPVFKARAALLGLDTLLRQEPRPGASRLAADLERVLISAHDFRELRLLAAVQAGRTVLPDDLSEEAQRLVGAAGTDLLARLGFEYEPTEPEVREALLDSLRRWREQAENPLLDGPQRAAAAVVVRTLEGMLTRLPTLLSGR